MNNYIPSTKYNHHNMNIVCANHFTNCIYNTYTLTSNYSTVKLHIIQRSKYVKRINMFMYISVFDKLIWHTVGTNTCSFLLGTAQFSNRASGAVNYDYIVTNSINSLLIGSRCIPNAPLTNHC